MFTKYRKDDFKYLWKEKWKVQNFLVGNYNIQMTNPSVTVAYSIYVQETSKVTINPLGPWRGQPLRQDIKKKKVMIIF